MCYVLSLMYLTWLKFLVFVLKHWWWFSYTLPIVTQLLLCSIFWYLILFYVVHTLVIAFFLLLNILLYFFVSPPSLFSLTSTIFLLLYTPLDHLLNTCCHLLWYIVIFLLPSAILDYSFLKDFWHILFQFLPLCSCKLGLFISWSCTWKRKSATTRLCWKTTHS